MGLSYRAILTFPDDAAVSGVVDLLRSAPDGAIAFELDGETQGTHRRERDGRSEISATLIRDATPRLVIERHEPDAVDESPAAGVPELARSVLKIASPRVGPFATDTEVQSAHVLEWARSADVPGLVVALVAADSEGQAAILARCDQELLGMAAIAVLTPEDAEQISLDLGTTFRLRPGSLVGLSRNEGKLSAEVLPATVVKRQPDKCVRRIRSWCLRSLRDWPLGDGESEVIRRARFSGGGGSDGDIESLFVEYEELESQLGHAQSERILAILELDEALEQLDELNRRVRFYGARLRAHGEFAFVGADQSEADELDDVEPASCVEASSLASELLARVDLRVDQDLVLQLDQYEESSTWAKKLWTGLRALHDYADARTAGDHASGFFDYCATPPAGYLAISAGMVAMRESESTGNDARLRKMRTFPVPEIVDGSGFVYMQAHLKIGRAGCAPRLHFHDDAAGTGHMYVGYIGPHLETAG